MADSKITALTALTAADPVNDMFPVVDVSDTSMAASGTTKRISVNNILGASGTATLASATITGAATVGTTLGVTGNLTVLSTGLIVNTTGVGIGATPVERLTIGSTTAANYIKLTNSGAATGFLIGSFNAAVDIKNREVGAMNFFTSDTQRMVIAATGDVTVSTGNVVMGTSGKGIDFSATANSSGTMTSELLNDYEEGTFTATLTGTVANPTIPVTTTGRYTKIGRVVSISAFFSSVITTGASGRIQITGLPFTNNSSITSVGTAAFNSMATFTGSPFASLAASDTTIIMFSSNSAASYASVNFNAGITQDLWVSLNYTVA
jgi:hypothetical protein